MEQKDRKIGLLTCSRFPELYGMDQQLCTVLKSRGYDALPVVWDDPSFQPEEWSCLIFRNTWDYFEKKSAFLDFLNRLDAHGVKSLNPLSLVRTNLHKFYLKEMELAGITIVPTQFISAGSTTQLSTMIPSNWDKVVVKPAFSAGAYETRSYEIGARAKMDDDYKALAQNEDVLLQPFMDEIVTEGEVSFVFFDKTFSHSVRKLPKQGDFRVQSLFGGSYSHFEADKDMLMVAQTIVDGLPEPVLYARVDGIIKGNQFYLMELELTEPDLYYELGENSLFKMVDAFERIASNYL